MTSGDLATARTLSGVRDGTETQGTGQRGQVNGSGGPPPPHHPIRGHVQRLISFVVLRGSSRGQPLPGSPRGGSSPSSRVLVTTCWEDGPVPALLAACTTTLYWVNFFRPSSVRLSVVSPGVSTLTMVNWWLPPGLYSL